MLDGSIVKVHQDATRSCLNKPDEAIGASVGGLSTKIHAKVDSFGQLLKIILSPGQAHESQFVFEAYDSEPCEFFLADKAYDIDAFRDHLRKDGVEAVIPSKMNRKQAQIHDEHIYKETFARLSSQGLFFRISQLFDLPFQKVPYFGHILDSLALLLTYFHMQYLLESIDDYLVLANSEGHQIGLNNLQLLAIVH